MAKDYIPISPLNRKRGCLPNSLVLEIVFDLFWRLAITICLIESVGEQSLIYTPNSFPQPQPT